MSWNRRRFIGTAVKVPVAVAAATLTWSCSDEPEVASPHGVLTAHQTASLRRFCYLLFPYPELGTAPYEDVVAVIIATTANQPDTENLISDGIAMLDDAQFGSWLELEKDEQLALLESIEETPFFQYMLRTTKTQLFNNRTVWAHIGYDPTHDLNDIDWLEDD